MHSQKANSSYWWSQISTDYNYNNTTTTTTNTTISVVYPFVGARPEHSQKVNGSNWGGKISADCLNVEIQLGSLHALDHRYPRYANYHHHTDEYTAQMTYTQGVTEHMIIRVKQKQQPLYVWC